MFPTVYVSHGSPMMLLQPESPAHQFLLSFAQNFGAPKAILVISAHWETQDLRVTSAQELEIIYDFYGFPQALYDKTYRVHGDSVLANRVSDLTGAIPDADRGIDHGAWVPLSLAYPKGGLPVVQLSLPQTYREQDLYDLGVKLQPLRKEGVFIIASGSMTHSFAHMKRLSAEIDHHALAAENWFVKAIEENDFQTLLNAQNAMPYYDVCHPTPDHWFPIYVAMGAAHETAQILHRGIEHRSLSMATVRFD
jgi:4,5-DOPA dioxygenase extradiol